MPQTEPKLNLPVSRKPEYHKLLTGPFGPASTTRQSSPASTSTTASSSGKNSGKHVKICASSSPQSEAPEAPVTFMWNGRMCTGTSFHTIALRGEKDTACKVLNRNPEAMNARFTYTTYHDSKVQEGSGLAIHLAASRGHVGMVQCLLMKGAWLTEKVTRDYLDHYDVFHAAVFAEGRSNNDEMVHFLLREKAPLESNLDGKTPLHLAFQVGSVNLVSVIRKEMVARGIVEQEKDKPGLPVPLMLGIQMGKMTEKQLARAAAHTPTSLRLFIKHAPRCIPLFLKYIKENPSRNITAQHLAACLHGSDVASIIQSCPSAASALFDALTSPPKVEHEGWHPLPMRMSFAPEGWFEKARALVNPSSKVMVQYVPECEWKYDVPHFEAPKWHEEFRSPNVGAPVYDVDVTVCRVPNIVCAEFFSALAVGNDDDMLCLFENQVVAACIDYVWWAGAFRPDMFQVFASFWCLVLLVLESWLVDGAHLGMMNASEANTTNATDGVIVVDDHSRRILGEIAVSASFIGAKGVVDLLHELSELIGRIKIKKASEYFNFGNFFDLFRSVVLASMLFEDRNSAVQVLVIFICWLRLLEAFTSAESIAVALLPIKRLPTALVPAIVMTMVSFSAFAHALHYIWGNHHDWRLTFTKSFATLITTELPEEPLEKAPLEIVVTYAAIVFFSVFILNIFIGVIGAQYDKERERVPKTFQMHRAQCCLNFLLRARVLPCKIFGRCSATAITVIALFCTVGLQVYGLVYGRPFGTKPSFIVLLLVLLLCTYQDKSKEWTPVKESSDRWYLWLATPRVEVDLEEDRDGCLDFEFVGRLGSQQPHNLEKDDSHGHSTAAEWRDFSPKSSRKSEW